MSKLFETENKPTYEDLVKERESLLVEIDKLKTSNENQSEIIELNNLKQENDNLRKLVEDYKNDLANTNKFAQQLMLEYGSRKQEQQEMTDNGKRLDAEYEAYKDAESALNDYLNSKGEN